MILSLTSCATPVDIAHPLLQVIFFFFLLGHCTISSNSQTSLFIKGLGTSNFSICVFPLWFNSGFDFKVIVYWEQLRI